MKKRLRGLLIFILLALAFFPITVFATESNQDDLQVEEEYLSKILQELNLKEVDDFTTSNLPEKYKFSDLISDLIFQYDRNRSTTNHSSGIGSARNGEWLGNIGKYVLDVFFYELSNAKPLFVEMILLAILFAVTNRICMTCSKYVSNMSFLVIYGAMMVLLMKSFLLVNQIMTDGLDTVIAFLKVIVPAYATTLFISGNLTSAGIFYELVFGMVLIIEAAMKYVLVPAIQIFVLLEFLDHLFEEERLSKLTELIETGVNLCIKIAFASVIGISVVQSLIGTAKDRLYGNTIIKSISMIPGIGNTFGAGGEILLGCGILIKNSVGVAAVILVFLICLLPIVKIFCFTFLYRVIVAMLQPVSESRIVECVHGVARGSALYLKLMVNTMILFIIVISMITAATSFAY